MKARLLGVGALLLAGCSTLAAAQTVRTVSLPANDLVYDAAHDRLYASVPADDDGDGNADLAVSRPS